jgi:hypothetical protein
MCHYIYILAGNIHIGDKKAKCNQLLQIDQAPDWKLVLWFINGVRLGFIVVDDVWIANW